MTKADFQRHIVLVTGCPRPSENLREFVDAKIRHLRENPDCPECKARRRTIRASEARRRREGLFRDCGLVKGKTGLGRTIWE